MAQLAVAAIAAYGAGAAATAAGVAAGTTFMGLTAAGWGWMVGSVVGSMLLAPGTPDIRQEQGKLSELNIAGSDYGRSVPMVFGRCRLGANIVHQGEFHEVETVTTYRGGKGAPDTHLTNYSYYVDAVAQVCAGPVLAVSRVWFDRQLVYTRLANATLEDEQASARFLETCTIHLGTNVQTLSIADVPTNYRNTVCLEFAALPITPHGNRIPTIEVEVITVGTIAQNGVITPGTVSVASIIEAICLDRGMDPSEIDVSALRTEVSGYVAANGSGAAQIEPVLIAGAATAVQSGDVLRFVPLDGEPVAVINADEISIDTPIRISRADETPLPRMVTVRYLDVDRDMQPGSQVAQRHFGNAVGESIVDLPIAITAQQAQQMAERLLYGAWTERIGVDAFRLPPRYLYLDPGDIIEIVTRVGTYRLVLTEVSIGADYAVECVAKAYDPEIGESRLPGADATTSGSTANTPGGLTTAHLISLPALSDADATTPGIWIAAAGASANWKSATVYRSADNGITWQSVGTITGRSVIGAAASVLPAAGIYVRDRANTVDVALLSGALASVSFEDVLRGANLALLGGELIQFQTATLISGTTWRLSDLTRGRRTTPAAGHAIGEPFVLMSTAKRITVSLSDLEVPFQWRVVANGMTVDDEVNITAAPVARSLQPFSPVHVHGTRDQNGDLSVQWVRRSRVGHEMMSGIEIPLGETFEQYRIDVLDGGAIKRTSYSSSPSWIYTAAMQTADWAGLKGSADLRIAQMSSIVGPGAWTMATL